MSINKYEKLYQEGSDVCGLPFAEFVAFFADFEGQQARVLDLGCGQGRDALFIARLGHRVVGVDSSPTGIKQMVGVAQKEGLAVTGIVADIVGFEPQGVFDVVLLDRVLHMLGDDSARTAVLAKATDRLVKGGTMLIADTPKQKRFLQDFFENKPGVWTITKKKKGFLFAQKM